MKYYIPLYVFVLIGPHKFESMISIKCNDFQYLEKDFLDNFSLTYDSLMLKSSVFIWGSIPLFLILSILFLFTWPNRKCQRKVLSWESNT